MFRFSLLFFVFSFFYQLDFRISCFLESVRSEGQQMELSDRKAQLESLVHWKFSFMLRLILILYVLLCF